MIVALLQSHLLYYIIPNQTHGLWRCFIHYRKYCECILILLWRSWSIDCGVASSMTMCLYTLGALPPRMHLLDQNGVISRKEIDPNFGGTVHQRPLSLIARLWIA